MQVGPKKRLLKMATKGKKSLLKILDDMIWLFNTQIGIVFTKTMYHWERGDQLNRELLQLGQSIHQQTNKTL
jgi:hypothetical protein